MYHEPVLLDACIKGLDLSRDGVYLDLTFGGGGHSREILKHLSTASRLIGFDQDFDSPGHEWEEEQFTMVYGNFAYCKEWLDYYGIVQIQGILADLGVSSYQLDTVSRGFSYRSGHDLDMRMNQTQSMTAKMVLNSYEEERLADIFWKYGEIRFSRKLARGIVRQRLVSKLEKAEDLVSLVERIATFQERKVMPRIFQALRIEVNRELEVLERLLNVSANRLASGGRLVIISYHSLEDRMVKQFMRGDVVEMPVFDLLTKKALKPGREEIKENPRSRSARLRIAQKK